MAIQRPDTPLAPTPIPKKLSDFTEYERKIMKEVSRSGRYTGKRMTTEEALLLSEPSEGEKLYKKLSIKNN